MWRIGLAFLVAGCGWGSGKLAAHPYRKRWQLMSAWLTFLEFLDSRIATQGLPLREIVQQARVSERFSILKSFLESLESHLNDPPARLHDTMAVVFISIGGELWEEERSLLGRLFEDFGSSNVEDERRRIGVTAAALRELQNHRRDQELRRARLLELFGIITGLAAVIVAL